MLSRHQFFSRETRDRYIKSKFLLTFKDWKGKRKSFYRQPQLEAFDQKEKLNTYEEKVKDDVEIENVEKEVDEKNKQEHMEKKMAAKKEKTLNCQE